MKSRDSWLQDLRHALRGLAAAPSFAVVAIVTLGLGIGANAAIFSLLDEAVLQRLPVSHPEQLRSAVVIFRNGSWNSNVPAEFFEELRRAPRALGSVLACWRSEQNFDTGGDTERVLVQYVSGGYYSTLGVPMFLGRAIDDADESAGNRVVVLSHRFWMQRFGGDPRALGSTVHVNARPATIIGVTPPGFFGIDRGVSPEITVPLPWRASGDSFANLWVTLRLQRDASEAEANAEAQRALDRALERIRPSLSKYRATDRQAILTLRATLRPASTGLGVALDEYLDSLRVLLLLSAALLLIACVNVAHLLLARALARNHEFSVRVALGASRARLIQQVLAESLILAALGSAAGIATAFFIQRALVRLLMQDLAHQAIAFRVDPHLLAYTVLLAGITVLIFGLVPAVHATRVNINTALQASAPRGRGRRHALAKALIAGQVAAALVLLVGAGLLLRSFSTLTALDTGVSLERMLTMRIGLSVRETQRTEATHVYTDLVDRVEAIPGVVSAALAWDSALSSGRAGKSIWIEGLPSDRSQSAGFNVVGPGFFSTAGIPVILGREFTSNDKTGAPKVVVVNEAWVREYVNGRNPIGLHVADSLSQYEVIGVVRDSRTMFLRRPPAPMLYQPLLQDQYASSVVLHVRTRENPWAVSTRVRAAIRALNPRLPVYDVTTLNERRDLALGRDRMMAVLSASAGMLALLLTIIGIYGVIAYSVGQRTTEIGIRMALGATDQLVRRLVVRETVTLVILGATIGAPLSVVAASILKSMLFGVTPGDPLSLVGSVLVLLVAGLVASYFPARRAARLDPATALRAE